MKRARLKEYVAKSLEGFAERQKQRDARRALEVERDHEKLARIAREKLIRDADAEGLLDTREDALLFLARNGIAFEKRETWGIVTLSALGVDLSYGPDGRRSRSFEEIPRALTADQSPLF